MAKKKPKIKPKEVSKPKKKAAPELLAVKAEYVPGSAGFLWTLHRDNDLVATGAQPYESMDLAIAAAHELLESISCKC